MKRYALLFTLLASPLAGYSSPPAAWYTQGDFEPAVRIALEISNPLPFDRENCPVIVPRAGFPMPDLHEMDVTVVDPLLPPAPEPGRERLKVQGGHEMRAEANGHAIYHQMDDLDKDGIWDELFFQTDLRANETKTLYIYIGQNHRGWNRHYTHANIGSYCRHQMPFWENEYVGWKIWFANSTDVYAKRKPMLVSHRLYMDNMDGYGVSHINHDFGSDIQSVANSLGGGGICLFEDPAEPEKISMPRFTPVRERDAAHSLWNAGQLSDTRYAYEVVVNGPVRSIIKIKGMNWDSGDGFYEYEQYYSVYARQSYCTAKVRFTTFQPRRAGVVPGCGLARKPGEDNFIREGGLVVSSGPEGIRDPENIDDREQYVVPFIGSALIVPDKYRPQYGFVPSHRGNHTFRVTPDGNDTYEYMLISAWSEGPVLSDQEQFNAYARKAQKEFNHPAAVKWTSPETKP